jgi:hypothetical protein
MLVILHNYVNISNEPLPDIKCAINTHNVHSSFRPILLSKQNIKYSNTIISAISQCQKTV